MSLLVEARDVVKTFGSFTAVDRMSLEVCVGEVVGLLGANGAGKTTFIRCLLGLTTSDAGTVRVLGQAPNREVLRQVGYMPQGLGLYTDLTVAENLAFRRRVYGLAPTSPANGVEDGPFGQLSLGAQRRAAFAAAIVHHPRLLVLDEPTSGVGPLGRAGLWDTIREAVEAGAGALVTTHHLEEAEQCDRLVMMAAGRQVASGSLGDVIGGRTVVVAEVTDLAAGFRALNGAGIPVVLTGDGLRVATADHRQVEEALRLAGLRSRLRVAPATLEEAFVALSR